MHALPFQNMTCWHYIHNLIDTNLRVEILFTNRGEVEKGKVDFKIGNLGASEIFFFIVFWWLKKYNLKKLF